MMYFFKTLACFNLLKVQVLHMLCTLKLKGVLHFPLKGLYQMLSGVHFLFVASLWQPKLFTPSNCQCVHCRSLALTQNRGILCSCWAPFCPLWVRSKTAKGVLQRSTALGLSQRESLRIKQLKHCLCSVFSNPVCILGEGEKEFLVEIVFNSILAFCSPSNSAKWSEKLELYINLYHNWTSWTFWFLCAVLEAAVCHSRAVSVLLPGPRSLTGLGHTKRSCVWITWR